MTNEQFDKVKETFLSRMKKELEAKNEDYTQGDVDRLAGFKAVAKDLGISPKLTCGVFMAKHWASIRSLAQGKQESEPPLMRCVDMANYALFLYAILEEEKGEAALPF